MFKISFFKIEEINDGIFFLLLILITSFVYSFLFTVPPLSLVGDAERYNGYQAYIIKYSLEHFGQFALWDQFLSSGMSWISHPGGGQFSPTAWIMTFLFKDLYFGARMLFFIHTLTAAFAFYLLFRILGLLKITSFFIAIVAVCNQYITLFVGNGWFEEFFGFTLLPATVGLLWHALMKKKYTSAILAAFVMSLNFFMNSYYVFHYNLITILWISLVLGIHQLLKRQFASFVAISVLFWIIFIGISSIKLLPLLEFRSISARNIVPLNVVESPGSIMTFSFLYSYLRDLLIPEGHTNEFTRWGNNAGLILFFLSLIYFLFKRSLRHGVFLGLFIVGIWGYFANRIPIDLYAFFYYVIPGFNSNMYPYRFVIIFYFAFLVCAALGLDLLLRQKSKFIVRLGYAMGLVLVLSVIWHFGSSNSKNFYPQALNIKRELSNNSMIIEKNNNFQKPPIIKDVPFESLEATLARTLSVYKPEGRMYSNSPNITNDLILTGEIPSVHHSYNPIIPTYQYGTIIPVKMSDPLELVQNRFKILSVLNARFQLQDKKHLEYEGCFGLDTATSSTSTNYVCEFLESRLTPLVQNENGIIYYDKNVLPKVFLISHPMLLIGDNRFNDYSGFIAKKIMFHPDFDERRMSILSGASPYLDDYDLETLRRFKTVLIVGTKIRDSKRVEKVINQYKNFGGNVVFLHSTWTPYESLNERSSSLWGNNPAWAYGKNDGKILSSIFKSFQKDTNFGQVKIEKFTPEDMRFQVATEKDYAVLQLSDSFYPGWKATIDGVRTPVYMADGLVKAVVVPPKGRYAVRMYYSLDSLKVGSLITGITLMIVLGIGILRLKTKMLAI